MNYNLAPSKHEHVQAHRHMCTKPPRHPHQVLTLFHLCDMKLQDSGSETSVRESHLHRIVGWLIREKRCCPWIQRLTNSGDVYLTDLTVQTQCHPAARRLPLNS